MNRFLVLVFLMVASIALGAGTPQKVIAAGASIRASEGAGTTTLVSTDNRIQIFNLSAARTVKMPSTGIKAGDVWTISKQTASNALTIQASGDTVTLAVIDSKFSTAKLIALQDTPTTNAHWMVEFNYSEQQYFWNQTYNGGEGPSISGVTSVYRGVFVPYQTREGVWRMKHNLEWEQSGQGSTCAVTSIVSGVTFKTIATATAQACAGTTNGGYNVGVSSASASGVISFSSYNCGNIFYSTCDAELESKPTWAY